MIEITGTDRETNISNPNGQRNKTKAEVLYDLVLAEIAGGIGSSDQALKQANYVYSTLMQTGIVYEVN